VAIIDIVRGTNGVQFALAGSAPQSPFTLNLTKGESVVFRNRDPREQHQITNTGVRPVKPDFWFPYPLATFVNGQPADVSSEVFFSTAGTVKFACALHPSETGTIVVT
jgi:plastocyanin